MDPLNHVGDDKETKNHPPSTVCSSSASIFLISRQFFMVLNTLLHLGF